MWPHRPAGFNEGRAPVNVDELISNYPILYHSTAAGNARSIVDHGLWTTAQIADTAQLDPNETAAMVAAPRPRAVKLTHPVLGDVQIRDQSPLRPAMLARCLTDLTPAHSVRLPGQGERRSPRSANPAGCKVAIDDGVDLVGPLRRLVDPL